MNMSKTIDFIKKYKTFIFLPIISLLLFFASFCDWLWIVATVFSVALLCISDLSYTIGYTLFFQMFTSFGYFSRINIFTAACLICLKYIVNAIRKKEKFYKKPFFMTLFICLFYLCIFYEITPAGVFEGFSIIALFFILYLIFAYREQINLVRCFDFLMCGIFVTAILSLISTLFKSNPKNIVDAANEIKRLKLFTSNENSLSITCSMALSFYIYTILNKKGSLIKSIIFAIAAACFGIATLSKSFLVVLAVCIIYILFMLLKKYKWQSFKVIIPVIVVIAIISLIFKKSLFATISRFANGSSDAKLINRITTNRFELWTIYINDITSSIPKMLFGTGMLSKRLVKIGPHNFFIHILHRVGFIGIIFIGILIYLYMKELDKKPKFTLKNCLPFVVLFMLCMIECFI